MNDKIKKSKNVTIKIKPNRRRYPYLAKEIIFVFPKSKEAIACDAVESLMSQMGYGCSQYGYVEIENK